MQFAGRQRRSGEIEYGIIFGALALAMLAAARIMPVREFLPDCFFRSVTGRPCPTCGSTRALGELAHGHFGEAFLMNPLLAALIVSGLIALAANAAILLLGLPRPVLILSSREARCSRIAAVVAVLGNWAYLIAMSR